MPQPTLEIRPPTPKRKRDREQPKPKIGPKIAPKNCNKIHSKKNPHPQKNHKIFMNVQGHIQLLTHQGLATSRRRKIRRSNPQNNSPPPPAPHPLTTQKDKKKE
jgi:hypothetical protein